MAGIIINLFTTLTILFIVFKHEEATSALEKPKYLVFLEDPKNDLLHPCPGVVISEKHILTTYNCAYDKERDGVVRAGESPLSENKKAVVTRKIFSVTIVSRAKRKKHKPHGALAIVTLKKNLPLNHHIIKTKLPEYNVKTGDSGLLSGFVSSCPDKTGLIGISDNIQSIQLTVSDSQKCKNIRDGEFCVNKEPKLGLIGFGAPIVNKGVIVGFARFSCSNKAKRAFTGVFQHAKLIQKILRHESSEELVNALNIRYFVQIVKQKSKSHAPCLGVVISDRHVITTSNCVSKNHKKMALILTGTFDFNMKDRAGSIRRVVKDPDSGLTILESSRQLDKHYNIIKAQLPTQNVGAGDILLISGFAGLCSENEINHDHNIQQINLTVSVFDNCYYNGSSGGFCIQQDETLIKSFEQGAPLVNSNGVIHGFTKFGCYKNAKGAVMSIFPHSKFIVDTLYASPKHHRHNNNHTNRIKTRMHKKGIDGKNIFLSLSTTD